MKVYRILSPKKITPLIPSSLQASLSDTQTRKNRRQFLLKSPPISNLQNANAVALKHPLKSICKCCLNS